jgi:hypothetical protein
MQARLRNSEPACWRDGRLVVERSSETAAERLELAMSLMERLSRLP